MFSAPKITTTMQEYSIPSSIDPCRGLTNSLMGKKKVKVNVRHSINFENGKISITMQVPQQLLIHFF